MIDNYIYQLTQGSSYKNIEPSMIAFLLTSVSALDVIIFIMLLFSFNGYIKSKQPVNHRFIMIERDINRSFMEGKLIIDKLCKEYEEKLNQ